MAGGERHTIPVLLTAAYVVRGVNTVSSIYLLHQSQIQAGQDVTEVYDDMTADSDGVSALSG